NRGGASERARTAGLGMFSLFAGRTPETLKINATAETLVLNLIAQIQADRNRRTLQAQKAISPVIWGVAIIQGVLVILMSFFLFPDHHWSHLVMASMLAALIAMMLFVVYIFDQPFRGVLPLKPEAFVHSLDVYNSVDRAIAGGLGPR